MGDDSGNRSLDALLREIARAPDAAVPSSLVGETLGRYRLDALLGRGGMGVVYRARDTKLDRDVALKLLPPELVGDAERRARFVREAKLAAQVTHPCVAAVYDVGEQDDAVYLAMELVSGRTLRVVLDEHPKGMPAADVARIGADLARGLAKAHEAGIVHRDLKPENVMLDDEGHPKILDFGLAKLREVGNADPETLSTELGRVLGTPSYMSPEQAKGKPVDARSDVFSLGIVLYEMLAAKRPFVGETTMEVLIAIDRDVPPPLAEARDGLPPSIVAVVERCLAKEPSERFQSAREIASALRGTSSGEHAALAPPRSRVALFGAIGVAVVGAVVFASPVAQRFGAKPTVATVASATPSIDAALPKDGVAVACPQLEATIAAEANAAWIGASAASFACARLTALLDFRLERTLAPAELLDAPRAPSEDLPDDFYGRAGVRERAVAAAKTRAPVWLDGRVDATVDSFHLELVLRARDGRELARSAVDDRAFNHAVIRAVDGLGITARPIAPEMAPWIDASTARAGLALGDAAMAMFYATPEDRDALAAYGDAIGPSRDALRVQSARAFGEPVPKVEPPALDRSTPGRFSVTVAARNLMTNDVGIEVADELHALAEKEKTANGRAQLLITEAYIREAHGDTTRNRESMLAVVQERPKEGEAWVHAMSSSYGFSGFHAMAKAYSIWFPEVPDVWNTVGFSLPKEQGDGLAFVARAAMLAPDFPLYSANYVDEQLHEGKPTAARAVAARLTRGGPRQRRAGEAMLAVADAATAAFSRGLERARHVVETTPEIGSIESGADGFMIRTFEMELLTTGKTTLADAAAERFVLADPPRVTQGHFAAPTALSVCGWAAPDVRKRCVARVRKLVDAGWFRQGTMPFLGPMLEAYERLVAGDAAAAAKKFRTILGALPRFAVTRALVESFERTNDAATLADMDRLRDNKTYAGVSGFTVHGARWANKRGDKAKAKELAQKVVDAWATADTQMVALDEMRAILAAR